MRRQSCLVGEALRAELGEAYTLRTQLPLALDPYSEPEADIAIVPGSPRDYRDAHPRSATLVVEVADTTLDFDRDQKGSLYARAGIQEYWIVNLTALSLEVCRRPSIDDKAPLGWSYQSTRHHSAGDQLSPLFSPQSKISIDDLFP